MPLVKRNPPMEAYGINDIKIMTSLVNVIIIKENGFLCVCLYSKTPRVKTTILRTYQARICMLYPQFRITLA